MFSPMPFISGMQSSYDRRVSRTGSESPLMNFGFQTILFGAKIDDLEYTLGTISRAGFTGVEFSQRPELLRTKDAAASFSQPVTLVELASLLARFDLTFLGMAGGTLEERMDFCADGARELQSQNCPRKYFHPLYLYVDSISAELVAEAGSRGFRLALHPHVFMPLDTVDAALAHPLFEREHVFLMPDTAHSYIQGGDPVAELQKIGKEKLIAVHLKDWDAAYGKSPVRYAKGFVPLGKGEVPLVRVISFLQEIQYAGWIVVEQDYTREFPADVIRQAARWLRRPELRLGFPAEANEKDAALHDAAAVPHSQQSAFVRDPKLAQAMLLAENCTLEDCYTLLAEALCRRFVARQVSIWSCNPTSNDLSLVRSYPQDILTSDEKSVLRKDTSLIGLAAETCAVQYWNGDDKAWKHSGRTFHWTALATRIEAAYAVAVPVPLRFNPHHIRYVVKFLLAESNGVNFEEEAEAIANTLNRAADFALEEDCAFVAGKVSTIANETAPLGSFLERLTNLIRGTLECQGVSIFLSNVTQTRLSCKATTGIRWRPEIPTNAQFYTKQDQGHPTVDSWREKRVLLVGHALQERMIPKDREPKSREIGPGVDEYNDNLLLMPICSLTKDAEGRQHIEVIGVVRCRNKRQPIWTESGTIHRLFTDDDVALLDTIIQTATPHIELRKTHEQRLHSVARMTHELKSPVNSLRGELDLFRAWLNRAAPGMLETLPIDHFDNLFALTDVAVRVVNNALLYSISGEALRPKPELTFIMGDIVAPAKNQIRYLLANEGFDPESIQYSSFEQVPRLYIDRSQFQQVFFNLLSNAIKYALPEPTEFKVRIDAVLAEGYYAVSCSDWGVGIPESYAPYIFDEGVRGPVEQAKYIEGLGLGLYVVRRVVEAHGGYVDVTRFYSPTTITMYLPATLRSRAPKQVR